ncbi:MAG TPA: hypothetical protein PKH91_04245 [Flavobacterium sp.]|nr:hypothetical protein [Flavobacterium sp.]
MNLENNSKTYKLIAMLSIASERLDSEITNIDKMFEDIKKEFCKKNIDDVIEAVRLGSLGKYGVNYKLTTQVVCFWIRCYTEPKIDKL